MNGEKDMNMERQLDAQQAIRLEELDLPGDLAELSIPQCTELCSQIRDLLIDTVMRTGGHLASNLGVVELTVALHRNFQSPDDRIVWDVGHQSYVHKILTGRLGNFETLRQENGLAGFPKPSESPHDTFITGHSSTAVSAAFGMAEAMRIQHKPNYAVAVVGDGAMTGGLFYEGLNNAGKSKSNIIVVLNDNKQSISKNVGAIAKYLAKIRGTTGYVHTKWNLEHILTQLPGVGNRLVNYLKREKDKLRTSIMQTTLFEDLGFVYLGPVDGHDIAALDEVLTVAKEYKRPVVVHVRTKKGKGYAPAEENPGEYHGVPRNETPGSAGIDPIDLDAKDPEYSVDECYSTVFGRELTRLASKDNRICAVTAAMKYGTGLQYFYAEHPDRFYDVGIAEQHATTFCAALASMNMMPVFAVYSSFLQRAYDQLLHDVSIAKYHVVLGVDRAGLVGEDGETHQGIFDVPLLRSIPRCTIYSPATYEELRICLKQAIYADKGLAAVRYPKGKEPAECEISPCTSFSHSQGKDILLITYGVLSDTVARAAKRLSSRGVNCGILRLVRLAPLPSKVLPIVMGYEKVYFFEESYEHGGLSEQFAQMLLEANYQGEFRARGIKGFVTQASVARCLEKTRLSEDAIVDAVMGFLQGDGANAVTA